MFAVFMTLLAVATTVSAGVFTEDGQQQKFLWEAFKKEHDKTYDSMDTEMHRFGVFLETLKTIDQRNKDELSAGGSAVHGITFFADMTQLEFESKYLLSDVSMKKNNAEVVSSVTAPTEASGLVDWTGKYTTPVKNQLYCGSCWAFSATEQIESDSMRQLSTSYILSPEQIVQCDTTSYGCNGGWTESAYSYVEKAGGLEQDKDYPYTSGNGRTGTCSVDDSKFVVTIDKYYTIKGESSMASYVQKTGPLSVCLDASSWNTYTGGVMSNCGKSVDHCVQAVGVDASSNGYWKIRNSWGTSWGESGFIRLKYGSNTCDITNDPTYTNTKKV